MNTLWIILKILALFLFLKLFLVQLNNWVFTIWRKPYLWLIVITVSGFCYIWALSGLANAQTILGWSGALGFFSMFPPSEKSKKAQQEANMLADEMYVSMGIPNGRKLYWSGIFLFLFGMAIGWVFSFSENYFPG